MTTLDHSRVADTAGHEGYALIPESILARKDLSAATKVVYCAMAAVANSGDGEGGPPPPTSRQSLADATGLAVRTVDAAVKDLTAVGLLRVEQRRSANGGNLTNTYVLP